MDPVVLLAMVDRCAVPEVPRPIVYAVALAESGGHRFVIRDNTTKTVHRFLGINAALVFMKTYPSHSLDIGLMQVNTRAHRVDPHDISPCLNIWKGSEILSQDMETSGRNLGSALCLYHRGKVHCGTYPEKVAAFLPRSGQPKQSHAPAGRPTISRAHPNRSDPTASPELAESFLETAADSGSESDLSPDLKAADVDAFMGR